MPHGELFTIICSSRQPMPHHVSAILNSPKWPGVIRVPSDSAVPGSEDV